MKFTNPDWYRMLEGNPLKKKTFTDELASKIRAQAPSKPIRKMLLRSKLSLAGLAGLCILGIFLFMISESLFSPLASEAIKQGNHAAVKQKPTDNEWQEILRQNDENAKLLHKETIGEYEVVFSKKVKGDQAVDLSTQLFQWNSMEKKWKGEQRGTSYIKKDTRKGNNEGLVTTWFTLDNVAVFMGVTLDPDITQIQVIDEENKKHTAKIFKGDGWDSYWYVALPKQEKLYRLETMAKDGNMINIATYSYR